MTSAPILIASCSPRKGGNCDFASSLIARTLPGPSQLMRVADMSVRPCNACGVCDSMPGRCTLDGYTVQPTVPSAPLPPADGAKALFAALAAGPVSFIVLPVYFYHIPAQAKAWVDRTQRWWTANGDTPARGKSMACVFVSGRSKGDKLFEGAERTMRWMAKTLGMEWCEPLHLMGLDGSSALADSLEMQAEVCYYTARVMGRVHA